MPQDKSWMSKDRASVEWQEGRNLFLDFAFQNAPDGGTIRCPCAKCHNICHKSRQQVHIDLLRNGMDLTYTRWIFHREKVVEDNVAEQPNNEDETPDDVAVHNLLSSIIRGTAVSTSEDDADNANGGDDDIHNGSEEATSNSEPTGCAKAFFDLLKDAQKELYPGCKEVTQLSFIVRLYQAKCLYGLNNRGCEAMLQLFSDVLPKGHCIPNSLDKVQKVIRDLGLDYQKIHACINNCVLFRKEYAQLDSCPRCGASRWKTGARGDTEEVTPSGRAKKLVPCKILRYVPLTPRLQRFYMAEPTALHTQWHKRDRVDDDIMRHPADSLAWKHFDNEQKRFSSDVRNVRLGLASDGFDPFGQMNVLYSTWPVILIPYNLPPWLCLKQSHWIMSMIIPGPKSPGNNIDVYLQPLIDELNDLWLNGAMTYDAASKKPFRMHAALLWTINDFPAYAVLSGWSTRGKLACPYCHIYTDSLWLKFRRKHCYMGHRRFLPRNHKWRRNKSCFDNKMENRGAPIPLSGEQVEQQYESFEQVTFGPTKKRKRDDENRWHNWKKKSIIFTLPYWKTLLIRHNLDVMHIEKNICDSILGTLLDMDSKSKDNLKARLDLKDIGVREDLHPKVDNGKYTLQQASYNLTKDEMIILCNFLAQVKMPDGYASNIKRCVDVNGCKVSGLKTHDCHVIFQKLLPIVIRNILPENVVVPLIELSKFFAAICSKELKVLELEKLTKDIAETMCKLEMIFPPALFDVMMHLPIHLAEEARLGGPVSYRWMYPIERYLRTLKGYVRNKAHPEGSMAEGYIMEECMTFCSQFFDNMATKLNRPERHEGADRTESPFGISIFSKVDHLKKGFQYEMLSRSDLKQIRHYIITNCEETTPWINEHIEELKTIRARDVMKQHKDEFVDWFDRRIGALHNDGKASDHIYALSRGPDPKARIYSRSFINGFFFRAVDIEKDLRTQNSSVVVKGDESAGSIDWYGVIKKIIFLDFGLNREVVLFKCDWFDVPPPSRDQSRGYKKDKYGIVDLDTSVIRFKNEPYILGIQAEQVFYVQNVKKPNWSTVVKMKPRNLFAMPTTAVDANNIEVDVDSFDIGVNEMNVSSSNEDATSWGRDGTEGVSGDASAIEEIQTVGSEDEDIEGDDEDDVDDTYINDGHVAPVVDISDDDEFFI